MPDLTPDVTTTPNFDPGRVAIASGWLVYDVGYHTCGGYGPESGYAHEPGCGAEPMCKVADIPDLLAAAAERDALAAKVERVRALHGPRVLQVLGATCFAEECDHEDACPLVDYTVCGHCYDVGDGAHPYAYEEGGLQDVAHPCATYRALDATPETGCES